MLTRAVLIAVAGALASLASPARAGDDEIIIIEEDNTHPAEKPPPPSGVGGALGKIWESWHVATDSDVIGYLQLTDPRDGPWRMLGSVSLETWLLPVPNLSFYANGFGRIAYDLTPEEGRVVPFADLYEAYAKVNLGVGSVQVGRLVIPWGRTQVANLADRLNAPDHRRGPNFPDPVRQKEPEWGFWLRTSLGSVGVEGVVIAAYEPPEGSLAAVNQGGIRAAHYQEALVRSPARLGGVLDADDTSPLDHRYALGSSSIFGARVTRRVGDIDFGGSAVWGFDDVPTLIVRPEVAHFLAAEVLAASGVPLTELPPSPCDVGAPARLDCVGSVGAIDYRRTASFAGDFSWGLGVVILRVEALAYPNGLGLPGKTALLVNGQGLRSVQLGQYAAALAVEGSVGDWITGSLEMFDWLWDSVPAGERLYSVEAVDSDISNPRVVHRLAVGASLSGAFLEDRFRWRLRGEGGILQPDVLMSAELRYRLPVLDLYVGGRTDVFSGVAGSPGWFRQDNTLIGVFVGEGA